MNWTSTALLSASLQGVVSVIDSHLLSKRLPGLRAFLLPLGIITLILSIMFFILFPWPKIVPSLAILAVIAASLCGTAGSFINFFVLQKEEVSRVVPILHTSPVFVALIAMPTLGESLDYLQWLAILIVVAGAVIISAEKRTTDSHTSLRRPFYLLFLASLLNALSGICAKYALDYISFWNMYALFIFSTSLASLAVSVRPTTFEQWRDLKQRNSTIVLFVLNEIIALTASILRVRAISLGPVSLVSAIQSTRPVLVAIYSMILGLVLPGFLIKHVNNRALAMRFLAIAMIVGGVSIIYLT